MSDDKPSKGNDERTARRRLSTIGTWAERQDDIRALILTGSEARCRADDLSDLDLELFTNAPQRYLRSDSWMADLGVVWLYLALENAPNPPTRLIIFDGGVKVDFTISDIARLEDMARNRALPPLYDRGYRALIDKDRLAARLPAAPQHQLLASPPSCEEFTNIVHEFWFEVFHVGKYLKREDLWAAKSRDHMVKQLLLTMLEWYEKSLHGWDYETEPSGIRVKDWVEPEIVARLMNAFAHLDAPDSWKALDVTVRLFRDLAQVTAARLGHPYPQDVDEHVSGHIQFLRGR